MTKRTIWLGIAVVGIILLVAIIAGGMYARNNNLDSLAAYQNLLKNNDAFKGALNIYNARDYSKSSAQLQKSIPSIQDPVELGVAQFYLAESFAASGEYEKSITSLKTIAASQKNSAVVRALAVQEMGRLYSVYGDPRIRQAIFADEPYKNIQDPKSTLISLRNIYEYAATIYPLAFSEYRVAGWYANDLLVAKTAASSQETNSQIEADKTAIASAIDAAKPNMTALQGSAEKDGGANYTISLGAYASLAATMRLAGDTTFDPDAAYQDALSANAKYGIPDGFTRISYATYLASSNADGAKVKSVLDKLFQADLESHGRGLTMSLKISRQNPSLHASYVKIAKIDSRFKALLISLGWQATDFK
jgi:hypothetical protein